MNFLVFFFYIFVMRPGHKRGGFREVVPLVLWYVGIPILSISWVFPSMQETACHCISMMWRIVGDWVPSLRTIICIHYINTEDRGWNPESVFHWGEYNCILDGIMEKVCNPTPSHLVLNGRGRTGKTNNTTSAAGIVLWWRWCCPLKGVSHSPDNALCDSVTESAMSWYKRQQGSSGDACVGTAFLLVQPSCGYTFLWVQQLPGYNVTVILALTPQQTLCTLEQFGSVDLASEWQLKYLCLQTARLTEFLQKPFTVRSWFHQNDPAICVWTDSHPVSESDAASVVVDE